MTLMLRNLYLAIALILIGVAYASSAQADDQCGDISIARMSWPSAALIAEIDKVVLSAGYDCNAELIASDTVPTVTSMIEESSPDLAPELWIDAVREPLDEAVASGDVVIVAEVLSDGAEEGWWIPKYVSDQYPHIKTPADALARPDLFPSPEDPDRGAVYNCPEVWKTCNASTTNLYKAYGAEEKGFDLVVSGSAAELDGSIARAHQRQLGWLGYYWAPTATLGRYEMVKLDMGEHDQDHWETCTAVSECEAPQVNSWAKTEVFSAVTNQFAAKAGDAMGYISKRHWDNATMNKLLAWMANNQATGEEVAAHFLQNYEDQWFPWVTTKALIKIRAALAQQ